MASKLKIKMGDVEFEYEGDAQFDTEAIKDLFSHLESLVGVTPVAAFSSTPDNGVITASGVSEDRSVANLNMAVGTIAARLSVSSGPELALAAAAYLQFTQGMASFRRNDLLKAMQSATAYYKSSMGSNISKALKTLVSNKKLNELTGSAYSLTAAEQTSIRARLEAE
ncbi:hypothetical protein F9K94_02200 [Brucella tritici]|uniref:Uncharacterized protein n=1 Tax=Brucella tritici TaxID=94626 RepID=A0A7V7VXP1_9HYPH|nr:hypothetical protein [Brucella tritici]KAB2659027.1 hypothetical protein F9K94_02200 [Brucella tritici]